MALEESEFICKPIDHFMVIDNFFWRSWKTSVIFPSWSFSHLRLWDKDCNLISNQFYKSLILVNMFNWFIKNNCSKEWFAIRHLTRFEIMWPGKHHWKCPNIYPWPSHLLYIYIKKERSRCNILNIGYTSTTFRAHFISSPQRHGSVQNFGNFLISDITHSRPQWCNACSASRNLSRAVKVTRW